MLDVVELVYYVQFQTKKLCIICLVEVLENFSGKVFSDIRNLWLLTHGHLISLSLVPTNSMRSFSTLAVHHSGFRLSSSSLFLPTPTPITLYFWTPIRDQEKQMTQTECVIHCCDFIPLEEDETLGKTDRLYCGARWMLMNVKRLNL